MSWLTKYQKGIKGFFPCLPKTQKLYFDLKDSPSKNKTLVVYSLLFCSKAV